MSVVAILERDTYWDIPIKNTLQIINQTYGIPASIYNAVPDDDIIGILNFLYTKGYRKFIGFSRSKVFVQVLDWFRDHPDCIGISCTSTVYIPEKLPSNLFRLTPIDNHAISSYLKYTKDKKVLVILEKDDPAALNIYNGVKPYINHSLVYLHDINPDYLSMIFPDYNVVLPLMVLGKNTYLEMLGKVNSYIPLHIDNIGETLPKLPPNITEYIYIVYRPELSKLVLDLQLKYGEENISPSVYDALQLLYNDMKITVTGAYGMIYFDENNNRANYFYSHFLYKDGKWKQNSGIGFEPGLGHYILTTLDY